MEEPAETLVVETRWQARRRHRRRVVDRLLSFLFGVIGLATIAYIFGLARMIAPVLVE